MRLAELLAQHRTAIVTRWAKLTLSSYPEAGAAFFSNPRDPIHNPVGATTHESLTALFDSLTGAGPAVAADTALDAILRIRSVQELTPAQAAGFVLDLKRAVREQLAEEFDAPLAVEMLEAFAQIDALALRAFATAMACREQVWAIRARQSAARVHTLLRRAEMLVDEECGPSPQPAVGNEGLDREGGSEA